MQMTSCYVHLHPLFNIIIIVLKGMIPQKLSTHLVTTAHMSIAYPLAILFSLSSMYKLDPKMILVAWDFQSIASTSIDFIASHLSKSFV